jgi:hypothetical protein
MLTRFHRPSTFLVSGMTLLAGSLLPAGVVSVSNDTLAQPGFPMLVIGGLGGGLESKGGGAMATRSGAQPRRRMPSCARILFPEDEPSRSILCRSDATALHLFIDPEVDAGAETEGYSSDDEAAVPAGRAVPSAAGPAPASPFPAFSAKAGWTYRKARRALQDRNAEQPGRRQSQRLPGDLRLTLGRAGISRRAPSGADTRCQTTPPRPSSAPPPA